LQALGQRIACRQLYGPIVQRQTDTVNSLHGKRHMGEAAKVAVREISEPTLIPKHKFLNLSN
jgi:hypothetical protein